MLVMHDNYTNTVIKLFTSDLNMKSYCNNKINPIREAR